MNNNQQEIHIFFTINDSYAGYLSTCIISILDNLNSKYSVCFYIIDGGISDYNKDKITSLKIDRDFSIQFIQIDQELFGHLPRSSQAHITKETNYRFLVSSLNFNLEKCIFLDVDLIAIGDISKLWETDIDDFYIAAVIDQAPLKENSWVKDLPLPDNYLYVNTGVTIINCKKWREDNIEKKLFAVSKRYSKILKFPDQDTLNIVLHKKIKYLSPIYNVMPVQNYFDEDQKNEAFANPQIIHWAGFKKPWKYPNVMYAEKFWHYAFKTEFYEEILFKGVQQSIPFPRKIGAVKRIKSHLSFRIGDEILKVKINKIRIIILPFIIIYLIVNYKISKYIYNFLSNFNPDLKLTPLNEYADYKESLKIKEYLTYRIGNLILRKPFTFIFYIAKEYREWKERKLQS